MPIFIQGGIHIAGKNHAIGTLPAVPPVNQVEEQPGIFLVEYASANFVNNQTRRFNQEVNGEIIRKDAKYDKQYLEGKYGADP